MWVGRGEEIATGVSNFRMADQPPRIVGSAATFKPGTIIARTHEHRKGSVVIRNC